MDNREQIRWMFDELRKALVETDWSAKFESELEALRQTSSDDFKTILRRAAESLSYYALILKDGDTLEVAKDFDLNLGARKASVIAGLSKSDKMAVLQFQNFILAMFHLVMQETFSE